MHRQNGAQVRRRFAFKRLRAGITNINPESAWFKSVRAETRTHVIMTGWWSVFRSGGTGVFIAVLPVQRSQIAIEDMAQAVSLGNYA